MKKLIYLAVLAAALAALVAPPAWAADDDNMFKFHGELRLRADYLNNYGDFNDNNGCPTCNDDQAMFFPSRARVAMEGQFTKNVSAWIEIQNTWVWGASGSGNNGYTPPGYVRGTGYNSTGNMELYQANMTLDELWSDNFSLTFGRQELVLGNELLLGDNDFYSGFTHDGIVATWDLEKWDVNLWYFREAEGSVSNVNGANFPPPLTIPGNVAGGLDFYGGYATWDIGTMDMLLDFYYMNMNVHNNSAPPPPTGEVTNVMTYGVRFARDMVMGEKGFMWNFEYAMQGGDIRNIATATPGYNNKLKGDFTEFMFGYNFSNGDNNHKVYLRYESMSGDDSAAGANQSSDYDGWVGMPGDIHDRFGKGDWFLPTTTATGTGFGPAGSGALAQTRGIDAWSIGYNGFYNDRHEFGIAYWDYGVNNTDNLATGLSDKLGSAYDIWYGFNYTRNVAFEANYSSFDPGDFYLGNGVGPVVAANPGDSATRLYGQVRLRF